MAGHEATVMWRGFNGVDDVARDINTDLLFGLSNQCLIIVSKFREVWDDFGRLASVDPRIVPTRRAVQPIIDRIDVWPGLRTFRNATLAHAYLDKSGRLLPPTALIRSGQAPTFHAEAILLVRAVVMAVIAILTVFEKEYEAIDPITRDPPGAPTGRGPGIALGTEIDPELKRVVTQVDKRLQDQLGLVTEGRIVQTFQQALTPRPRNGNPETPSDKGSPAEP
jgi:hypothetical protein